MKTALTGIGLLCLLMGGIWFLQGINVLPGSFMTGQIEWAYYGGGLAVLGLLLVVLARRRSARDRTPDGA
jgi:hypothetical protein